MMYNRLANTTYLQMLWVGILMLLSTLIFSALSYVFALMFWGEESLNLALAGFTESSSEIAVLRLFQLASHLGLFIVPVLSLFFVVRSFQPDFLKLNTPLRVQPTLQVMVLYIVFLPLIQYLMEINQQMSFPESLRSLELWMMEKEEMATQLTNSFLSSTTTTSLLANLLIMAVVPALGEELLFRGLLNHWFGKIIRNPHLNIILVSLLFSAIHLQFFGFIPRFALGMVLGYLTLWTQSLWYPILLHLLNNGVTVLVYYGVAKSGSGMNPEEVGNLSNPVYMVLSVLATSMVLYAFWKRRIKF